MDEIKSESELGMGGRGSAALGAFVRHLRAQAGLSQVALSKLSGVDNSTISKIELGVSNGHSEVLRKLAQALNVGEQDLEMLGRPPRTQFVKELGALIDAIKPVQRDAVVEDRRGLRILYSESEIAKRVKELGAEIEQEFRLTDGPIIFVVILKGAATFASDLIRNVGLVECQIEYVKVHTMGDFRDERKPPALNHPLDFVTTNRHVVLIEDVIDSGATLKFVHDRIREQHPRSIRVCSLLNKRAGRTIPTPPIDFLGFEIDDHFVVGYGLDEVEYFRELPYIAYFPDRGDKDYSKVPVEGSESVRVVR